MDTAKKQLQIVEGVVVDNLDKYKNLEERFEGFNPKSVFQAHDELEKLYSDIKEDIAKCEDDETLQFLKNRKRFIIFALAYYNHVLEDKCGYWGVCLDHHYGCGCSPSAEVNKGFKYSTYESLRKEYFRS